MQMRRDNISALEWAEKREYNIIISGGRDAWKIAERIASQNVPVIFRHVFTARPQETFPSTPIFVHQF